MSHTGKSAFCTGMFSDLCNLIYIREIWWYGIIPHLTNLWNTSKPEIQILVSLSLQIFLLCYGNRRKHVANSKLQFSVWLAFQAADGVAISTLSVLSVISQKSLSDHSFIVMMTWAPFLLLHLGGPDTISALSLEDNELWMRHSLQLSYQLIIAVLVVVRSGNGNNQILYVTIPMFIAAIIKCSERIWARRFGSYDHLRKSILPPGPDPGPNYANFMDEYTARKAEGYNVSLGKVVDTSHVTLDRSLMVMANSNIPDASAIHHGLYFFNIFKCLFADLNLGFQDRISSRVFFRRVEQTWEHAFKVIEVELSLMYDRLYTKALVTYSFPAFVFRSLSLDCTIFAFISFCLLDKGQAIFDKIITFVLLMTAFLFEVYGVIALMRSHYYSMLGSSHFEDPIVYLLHRAISVYQRRFKLSLTTRWTNEMSQFNFLGFCLIDKQVKCTHRDLFISKLLEPYYLLKSYYLLKKSYNQVQHRESLPPELKELIFEQLKEKSGGATDYEACKRLCDNRGDRVLQKCNLENSEILGWSIKKVEFDQSILLWHIATDLCYHSDQVDTSDNGELQSYITRSRLLSNYMLYLLVINPSMLPPGIGQIRFEDTLAEASEVLDKRACIKRRYEACDMILGVNTEIPPSEVKGDSSKSVLFDACRLAKSLQSLESEQNWTKERKWEMMSHVWVEMLCHAACHSTGLPHAKQLSKGGELLTHVWLLMAHFGITVRFQISEGRARAKLLLS